MVVTIPVDSLLPAFDMFCVLDGSTYGLAFRWNERGLFWSMGVYTSDGTPIVDGIRVVVDWPLGTRHRGMPPGALTAQDTSGQRLDPGAADFGTRVLLLYWPLADLP